MTPNGTPPTTTEQATEHRPNADPTATKQRLNGLPLTDYAARHGLTTEAVRMRVKRGRLAAEKRDGRWHIVTPDLPPAHLTEQPTQQRLNSDPTTTEQTLSAAVAGLTTQLTVKDAQLAEKDRQIGTLQQQFADRSREVSELHVLLQNAQRLQAGASPDASQTRSVPSGDANGAQTTDHPGLLIAELSALNRQLVEERMARRQAEESLQRFDDEFLRKQAGIEARLTRLTNDSSELNDWWDRLGLINPETHKPSFLRALWLAPLLVPSQLRRIIPYFICSLLASVVIAALFTHYLPDTRLWTVIRLVIVIGLVGILSEVFFPTLRRRRQRQRGRGFLWFSPSEVYTIAGMYVAVIGVAAQQTPFGIWRFVCYGTMIFVGIASVCVASYIKQRAANGAVGMTEAPNVASIS